MASVTMLLRQACRALENLEDIEGIEVMTPALRKWWKRAKRKSPAAPYDAPQYWAAPADRPRLTGNLRAVFRLLKGGEWYTIAEIAEHIGTLQTSASSRVRDLRNPKFGGYNVQVRRRNGVYMYRLRLEAK